MGNVSISKVAIIDRRSFAVDGSLHNTAGRITIIELHDPILPPQTCCELLKGILIMKFSILCLCISGILVKYHYETNSNVTIYDMVFVRAFSQLIVSYGIALKDRVNLMDVP